MEELDRRNIPLPIPGIEADHAAHSHAYYFVSVGG
jgi:hypothetical protein